VHSDVWSLFERKASELSNVPVLIEWDDELPSFETLESELVKAEKIWSKAQQPQEAYEESALL